MWEIVVLVLQNQWARLIAGIVAAYLVGFYSVQQPDIQAIVHNAEIGRDAQWKDTLDVARKQNDAKVVAALDAGKTVAATPAAPADRMRVCRQSATCRDRGR